MCMCEYFDIEKDSHGNCMFILRIIFVDDGDDDDRKKKENMEMNYKEMGPTNERNKWLKKRFNVCTK